VPLEAPNLDDRRFTELFEEMKSLIPRFAPEWTDYNLSDPGITLIQLFAWLGEMTLYRLNRVPERNYIKFLKLIGVERKPAFPANVELTFTLASPDLITVVIPQGTQVKAAAKATPSATATPALPQEDEQPIVFETDEPLYAIGAELKKVQVFDGINYQDFSEENRPSGKYYPVFGTKARENSTLMIGFASNNAFPTVEINLTVIVYKDPSLLREESCILQNMNVRPPAVIAWEYWNGAHWKKLDVIQDETRALTKSGHVYFNGPKDAKKGKLGNFSSSTDEALYWLRCRLVQSQYEIAPQVDAIITNTVCATAVTTVRDEVVGASNGQPNQNFFSRKFPVFAEALTSVEERIYGTVPRRPPNEAEQASINTKLRERELIKGFLLEIDEGRGLEPWEEVEDFFNSGPTDRHYVLNRTIGQITFSEKARTPIAGSNNIVVRYYRYGGGAKGNVGAGTITDAQTVISGLDTVTNNYPAEGGADEEQIEDTKARAPKELKARDRAVTTQDFEFLAKQTPGVRVRRAHALPLYHPQFPDIEVPGVITVMIVPESSDAKPMPSESTMQAVCAYLNERRLLTTEVFVAAPRYKQIKIEATIIAMPSADLAKVKTKIGEAITLYLHPLTGGSDRQGWPLGGAVLFAEIFRVILGIEGVQTIQAEDLRIIVDDETAELCRSVEIPHDYLVFSDGHEITVTYTPSTS
jgi:uncharacterized phage protein gp47/JayE